MKVVGLVTEYNPFHKGHEYHIRRSREVTGADFVLVVMSGNFVQRGEPAVVDKWTRTKTALACGADLVIEIPVHYATASAEYFAAASVALLDSTGVVDGMCFGSENGDLEMLDDVAGLLVDEPERFKLALDSFLGLGHNFPKARAEALGEVLGREYHHIVQTPNNILGIEYLKALKRQQSPIIPHTIQRRGAGYHDLDPNASTASASAVRRQLELENHDHGLLSAMLPKAAYEYLNHCLEQPTAPIFMEDFFPFLRYNLLNASPKALSGILDVTEGLENRILSGAATATSMAGLLKMIETRRYTRTKLSRALLHILLNIDKRTFEIFNNNGYAQYLKILGFRREAQPLLRRIKENARVPMIVNVKDSIRHLTSLQTKMLEDEIRATQIYNTAVLDKFGILMKNDYTQPILMRNT